MYCVCAAHPVFWWCTTARWWWGIWPRWRTETCTGRTCWCGTWSWAANCTYANAVCPRAAASRYTSCRVVAGPAGMRPAWASSPPPRWLCRRRVGRRSWTPRCRYRRRRLRRGRRRGRPRCPYRTITSRPNTRWPSVGPPPGCTPDFPLPRSLVVLYSRHYHHYHGSNHNLPSSSLYAVLGIQRNIIIHLKQ